MTLYDKIYGCLLASAIGNGMGHPVESWQYPDIEAKHGRITTLIEPGAIDLEDYTYVGLLLCRTYIEKDGRVTSNDLAKVWLRDMDPIGHRLFWCMKNAYELLKQGVSPRLAGQNNIVTGSAIMAIAPVGIYNAFSPDDAYIDATDISFMYQRGLDVDCACIMAACIAEAMKPTATVDSILKCALQHAPKEPLVTLVERQPNTIRDTLEKALDIAQKYDDVFEIREPLYQNCLQWHPIDPLEVLTLTLAIFSVAKGNTQQAIIGGTNIGRDADTIASLNGALAGALNGIQSVPQEWIDSVSPKSVEAFAKVARQFTQVVENRLKHMQKYVTWQKQLS